MSIEQTLQDQLASSLRVEHLLEQLIAEIGNLPAQPELPLPTPTPAAVVVPTPAPAPAPAAHVEPPPPAIPPLPVTPAFVPPMPAPAAAVPFSDQAGLIKYCMERYRALGATKGGSIQGIINGMGCANVADLPSTRWAEFYAKCEAL